MKVALSEYHRPVIMGRRNHSTHLILFPPSLKSLQYFLSVFKIRSKFYHNVRSLQPGFWVPLQSTSPSSETWTQCFSHPEWLFPLQRVVRNASLGLFLLVLHISSTFTPPNQENSFAYSRSQCRHYSVQEISPDNSLFPLSGLSFSCNNSFLL